MSPGSSLWNSQTINVLTALCFPANITGVGQDFIKTGKIKYVFNNVPIDQIHPTAFKGAEAAECARDQGKFWEMHDQIFTHQKTLSLADLNAHAKSIGLEPTQFSQCLTSGKNAAVVKAGLAQAAAVGVDGTPTFVIALTDARNPLETNLKVVGIISGAQPFAVFKSALDKALAILTESATSRRSQTETPTRTADSRGHCRQFNPDAGAGIFRCIATLQLASQRE
jgi:hypothetical protein